MYQERVVLDEVVMLELTFRSPADYRLACTKGRRLLVEYGRPGAYEFKSVEKRSEERRVGKECRL